MPPLQFFLVSPAFCSPGFFSPGFFSPQFLLSGIPHGIPYGDFSNRFHLMRVLVINCGSSSVKFHLIDLADGSRSASGKIESIGEANGKFQSHQQALDHVVSEVGEHSIDAVGHRVVHGGEKFIEPAIIDADVIAEIDACAIDAPLHNPFNLLGINIARAKWPEIAHVAVFDTAFHVRMPRRAREYAIDADISEKYRIRRFGFHGTSHEYVAGVAAKALHSDVSQLRIVTLHLGNGASACAVEYGKSTETSMGMTPLEGLVMGSRSGDIDAGAVMSLLRSGDFTVTELDDLLNRKSGLLGLSGIGNDLRKIEDRAAEGDDRARKAINVFAHRVRKYIGAYAAVMGGIDAVVFTGGIGENSATMRRRILQRLEFLGLVIDEDLNRDASVRDLSQAGSAEQGADNATIISDSSSRVRALVVKTDEELMIARLTKRVVSEENEITVKKSIPVAISARHVHLTQKTFEALFGAGATPTVYREISQPGQFACEEKVNLIGPRNRIDGVRILGPLRSVDQIEIARTDEFKLGVDAPIRDSGKVQGSAPITLEGPAGTVNLTEGLICARRHIHMHPDDASVFGVADRDIVEVAITGGPRDLAFGDTLIRVSEEYLLEMHIDTDEANAAELGSDASGELICDTVSGAGAQLKKTRG